jgi:hypothetical protein
MKTFSLVVFIEFAVLTVPTLGDLIGSDYHITELGENVLTTDIPGATVLVLSLDFGGAQVWQINLPAGWRDNDGVTVTPEPFPEDSTFSNVALITSPGVIQVASETIFIVPPSPIAPLTITDPQGTEHTVKLLDIPVPDSTSTGNLLVLSALGLAGLARLRIAENKRSSPV